MRLLIFGALQFLSTKTLNPAFLLYLSRSLRRNSDSSDLKRHLRVLARTGRRFRLTPSSLSIFTLLVVHRTGAISNKRGTDFHFASGSFFEIWIWQSSSFVRINENRYVFFRFHFWFLFFVSLFSFLDLYVDFLF